MEQQQNILPDSAPLSPKVTFWKTDGCALLFLLIFWPIGLFLMWKYSTWKKWVKVVVTIIYTPTIAFFSLLFGLWLTASTWLAIDNKLNPVIINQANGYDCRPISSEWGKCINLDKKVSLEYPLSWYYAGPDSSGISFSPNKADLVNNESVITFTISDSENEAMAKDFASKFGDQPIVINGISGTTVVEKKKAKYNIFDFGTALSDKNTIYQFEVLMTHPGGATLSEADLGTVYNHMVNSFKKESQPRTATSTPEVQAVEVNMPTTTTAQTIDQSAQGNSNAVDVRGTLANTIPSVDLKVNGSDGPLAIGSKEKITISWTTKGSFASCSTSGNWQGVNLPTHGTQTQDLSKFMFASNVHTGYGIWCSTLNGQKVFDSVDIVTK